MVGSTTVVAGTVAVEVTAAVVVEGVESVEAVCVIVNSPPISIKNR